MTHNAKRYQFLRDRFALESNNDEADFAALAHLNGDEFDAALDAAMLKAGFEVAQEVEPVAHLHLPGVDGEEYSDAFEVNIIFSAAEKLQEALVKYSDVDGLTIPLYTAHQAVNAELLEALQEIVDGCYPSATCAKARAAIQKAEGAKP